MLFNFDKTYFRLLTVFLSLFLLTLSINYQTSNAQDFVTISNEDTVSHVESATRVFPDTSDKLTIEEVTSQKIQMLFVNTPAKNLNFGYTSSAIWLALKIKSVKTSQSQWYIEIDYPALDVVTLFTQSANGSWKSATAGDTIPFATRVKKNRRIIFPLDLPQGEIKDIYIRVKSEGSVQIPLRIVSESALAAQDYDEQLLFGIVAGIYLIMFLYHGVLFLFSREKAFLFHAIYVICSGVYLFAAEGHASQYLWPEWPWWGNRANVVFIACATLSSLLYSRSMFQVKLKAPWLDILLIRMVWISLFSIPFTFMLPYRLVVKIVSPLPLLAAVMAMMVGFASLTSHKRIASFFLLGWSCLFAAYFTVFLRQYGILPANFFTGHAVSFGSTTEIILLSMSVGAKFYETRRERDEAEIRTRVLEAQAKLERQMYETRIALERDKAITEERSRHIEEIARMEQRAARSTVNAMLAIADRFNSPATAIINHSERLRSRSSEVARIVEKEFPLGMITDSLSKQIDQIKKRSEFLEDSARQVLTLSQELNTYRESSHYVNNSDVSIEQSIDPFSESELSKHAALELKFSTKNAS